VTGTETNGRAKRATLFLHKSTGFFFKVLKGKKNMKSMVHRAEEIFQLGRQPLKKSSAQQYMVLK
jgi:hypothetical protein